MVGEREDSGKVRSSIVSVRGFSVDCLRDSHTQGTTVSHEAGEDYGVDAVREEGSTIAISAYS